MPTSRSAVFVIALAFLWSCRGNADARKVKKSSTGLKQQVRSVSFPNNGQHWDAIVGQQIDITLGTVGPRAYGTPQVSFLAVQFEGVRRSGSGPRAAQRVSTFLRRLAKERRRSKFRLSTPTIQTRRIGLHLR